MRTVEDLLRAAVHETAREITPERVPPAPPPPAPGRIQWARRSWTGPRWRVLAPLAAAVAVVAVVVASLALAQLGLARHTPTGTSAASSVPPYYVALTLTGHGSCCAGTSFLAPPTVAQVKSTATGTVLATVRPPKSYGTFVLVSGAANDRTFALAAQPLVKISGAKAHPSAQT
ncbi:MAG TPA: hypothetical protein VGH27_32515 [Streptosporangiaceae bacterium]|jgi:hypothetical protein